MGLVRGNGNVALDNAMSALERHCAYCDSFPLNVVVSTRYQTHSTGPREVLPDAIHMEVVTRV